MAAKMATASITTAITALSIHVGTYFLGGIVGLATEEWIRYVVFAYNVCKSNISAKMAAKTCNITIIKRLDRLAPNVVHASPYFECLTHSQTNAQTCTKCGANQPSRLTASQPFESVTH